MMNIIQIDEKWFYLTMHPEDSWDSREQTTMEKFAIP